jgi:rhodanese-related sulfurtransferase
MVEFELDPEKQAWAMAEAAEAEVEVVDVEQLRAEMDARDDEAFQVLDIRDIREVWIEGSIPDVRHAPRGMLEFWADPDTVYYRDYFHPGRRYVLYCNEGGRSALAAKRLKEMGYEDVAHLAGGFTAWQEAGCETVEVEQKDYSSR